MFFITKKRYQEAIARQSILACEESISELGAEIHDDLIQRLTIFRLTMDKLERNLSSHQNAEQIVTQLKAEYLEVIDAVRRTSQILLPPYLDDQSLTNNILTLCQTLERPGSGTIHFESLGDERVLPQQHRIHLNRVVQESIHNSLKHSAAWHIWVSLLWSSSHLTIKIEDDGSGFSKIPVMLERLHSKRNTLKMRCDVLKAKLDFMSGEKGLIVKITYPYPRN